MSTAGFGAAPAETAPAPRRTRPGRHLRPVPGPARRGSPAVPVLVGAGIVLVALFGLAVMHALLIGGQVRLDAMQRQVASETEEVRRLRLRVAELESPERVSDVARTRLGMVDPDEIGYLLPVGVETGSDDPVRVAAATRPEPEPEPPVAEAESGADADVDADAAEVAAAHDGGDDE